MTYSNEYPQIRAGFVNYIGSLISSSSLGDSEQTKHYVCSTLTEEILSLAKDKDGIYDLYILKPLLRGIILIFNQRIKELESLNDISTKETIANYKNIIITINKLVDKI